MRDKQVVMREIENLPEPLFQEVLDFVRFLKAKANQEKLDTALLSETVLASDWLRPEEDEVWRDLYREMS